MNNELIVEPERPRELLDCAPADRVRVASELAKILADVIVKQKLFVQIGGQRKYVLVEGWQTVGMLAGVAPREVESYRDDLGWHSRVQLVRTDTGGIVGEASSLCQFDEKFSQNKSESAIKSMATTRATGKAFRLSFGWVMKLAGYESTPAEEMLAKDAYQQEALAASEFSG